MYPSHPTSIFCLFVLAGFYFSPDDEKQKTILMIHLGHPILFKVQLGVSRPIADHGHRQTSPNVFYDALFGFSCPQQLLRFWYQFADRLTLKPHTHTHTVVTVAQLYLVRFDLLTGLFTWFRLGRLKLIEWKGPFPLTDDLADWSSRNCSVVENQRNSRSLWHNCAPIPVHLISPSFPFGPSHHVLRIH